MEQHPIADLFKISLDCIKEMIDVNTICGEAIAVNDETSVIPGIQSQLRFRYRGLRAE